MTRRCSHCSNNGHNSRTCPTRSAAGGSGAGAGGGGVRIFGVQLRNEGAGFMKKSASMSCLAAAASAAGGGGSSSGDLQRDHPGAARASGYASDDPSHGLTNSRKKGTPWTEEEHRKFLLGLQELGKGDWRGISQRYVVSRTPTQVASHAQKYFIRQSNTSRRKRRSSLFDMVSEMTPDQVPAHEEQFLPQPSNELVSINQLPNLHIGQQGPEAAETLNTDFVAKLGDSVPYNSIPVAMVPTFYPAFIPVPVPFWPSSAMNDNKARESHEIFKPTPVVAKDPVNSDAVVGMSKLSIKEGYAPNIVPSSLSLKLTEASNSRQSAFHINPSIPGPDITNQSSSSPIHAV